EDGFFVEGAEHERVFARRLSRLPRAQRQDGFVVTARFHLHPDVAAAMVADGEAITLRLPHGEVWVMRQAGGALSLAQSVYTGAGGAPTSTRQIVVTASAGDTATKIRWAFRRVGELEQLPRDVEGLLRLAAMDAEDDEGAGAAGRVATRREPL
ncbi:MAG: heparinase II/III family protein, partial [Pseudomonadota bacterium]